MNKNETLDYLVEKRKLTAPVSRASTNKNGAIQNYDKALKRWNVGIIILIILIILNFLGGGGSSALILLIPAIILIVVKVIKFVTAKEELDKASKFYNAELNKPEYLEGMEGFPSQFYNHADCYRLWRLIEEGRAQELKEAYNLLEQQHYYEDQLSVQQEIKALQQDISNSAKVTAVSSTISAFNTANINSKLKR